MAFDGSYPAPPGNKRWSVIDVALSGTYTVITIGTPPTGGVAVSAAQFGLQSIEAAWGVGSDNGAWIPVVFMKPFNLNQPSPNLIVQLTVALTGAELAAAQSLTGRKIRLIAMGAY